MEQKRIKVRLTKNSPYSDYGYYEKGDIGYIDGYVNDNAVIILENGKFAKAELTWIEVVNDEDKNVNTELKESDDERIMKDIVTYLQQSANSATLRVNAQKFNKWIAWIEEQEQHKKFRDSIQVGDKVTKNEDGVLVNLSQLSRVAKKDENQGEQKPSDKVEPKFKVGDFIIYNRFGRDALYNIVKINERGYYVNMDDVPNGTLDFKDEVFMRLWTIQDANDGDVLASKDGEDILIFRNVEDNISFSSYYNIARKEERHWSKSRFIPATKEQRDKLEKAMADAGYTFDFEKKELKKIEQPKQEWSEEDERLFQIIIDILDKEEHKGHLSHTDLIACVRKLKSLRPPYYCDNCKLKKSIQGWKPSDEQMFALNIAIEMEDGDILKSLYQDLLKLREE